MTPIEKNVIVVDEQGNEYEATYPKRAKGLVKNGRARFIGENKICLACPPEQYLEENKMEENKTLTKREVFEQIVKLQENIAWNNSLNNMTEAINSICQNDIDMDGDERQEAIEYVCMTFQRREQTLVEMIHAYENIYNDLKD